jgi:FG-GAP-like repeat
VGSRQLRGYFILPLFLLITVLGWQSSAAAGRILLWWNDNANNEDGFIIERKIASIDDFAPVAALGINATSYMDTNLIEGTIYCYRVAAFNILGASPYTPEACEPAKSNLYHVFRIGIFRPATGEWFMDSGNGVWDGCAVDRCVQFGTAGDSPVPADYDGDGKVDIAVYRGGGWYILRSSDGVITPMGWGGLPQDKPVPHDYDGDNKADIAIYRGGSWHILRSSDGGVSELLWGDASWMPVVADYDGDSKADIAVYHPNGQWAIVRSSDVGQTLPIWGGSVGDIPVPADYDGDGKADIAVYNPNGTWSIARSSDGGYTVLAWGGSVGDIPVPADYDGDGKVDIAVYNPNGTWSIARSSHGPLIIVGLGTAGDIPIP